MHTSLIKYAARLRLSTRPHCALGVVHVRDSHGSPHLVALEAEELALEPPEARRDAVVHRTLRALSIRVLAWLGLNVRVRVRVGVRVRVRIRVRVQVLAAVPKRCRLAGRRRAAGLGQRRGLRQQPGGLRH